MKSYKPISDNLEIIGKEIVDSAFSVHKILGPGLLEKVYGVAFCHEIKKRGLKCERQVTLPIVYDGITFIEALRLDVLVEGQVVCELKAVDLLNPVWDA